MAVVTPPPLTVLKVGPTAGVSWEALKVEVKEEQAKSVPML